MCLDLASGDFMTGRGADGNYVIGSWVLGNFEDEFLELFSLGPVGNRRVILNRVPDVRGQGRQLVDKLRSDCCKEHSCFATIAVALVKKEAGARYFLRGEAAGHNARYYRFAGAGHTAQPEDTFPVRVFDPSVDLGEKVNSGIGMTCGVINDGPNTLDAMSSFENDVLVYMV